MRWLLIFALSLHGLVVGGLSVAGLLHEWREFAAWMVAAAIVAPIAAFNLKRMPMANGFMIGLLGGLLRSAVVLALFDTYLANNPIAETQLTADQIGYDARVYYGIITPPISMAWGLFVAVGTLVVFKLRKPPPPGGSGLP